MWGMKPIVLIICKMIMFSIILLWLLHFSAKGIVWPYLALDCPAGNVRLELSEHFSRSAWNMQQKQTQHVPASAGPPAAAAAAADALDLVDFALPTYSVYLQVLYPVLMPHGKFGFVSLQETDDSSSFISSILSLATLLVAEKVFLNTFL